MAPLSLFFVPHNIRAAVAGGTDDKRETAWLVAFWTIGAIGLTALEAWRPFLLFWIVPYLTTFQLIRYWAEMAEHAGLAPENRNPWRSSRNWRSNLLVEQILACHRDDLYHLTHHLLPAIAHFRLAAAHDALMAVPEYADGVHCDGFLRSRGGGLSVWQSITASETPPRSDGETLTLGRPCNLSAEANANAPC